MIPEAKLVEREGGLEPEGEGWFVVNAHDAAWFRHDVFGACCSSKGRNGGCGPGTSSIARPLQSMSSSAPATGRAPF